jgi:hypothetical protein
LDFVAYAPQVELAAFPGPPIRQLGLGGVTVTRAPTNLSIPGTFLRANDFGVMGLVIPGAMPQNVGNDWYFSSILDINNFCGVYDSTVNTVRLRKTIASTNYLATAGYTPLVNTPFLYQVYQSSVYGMGVRVRPYSGGVWGAWSAWVTKNDADGRLDAPIAATVQIGGRNNANHVAGNCPGVLSVFSSDPRAELEKLGTTLVAFDANGEPIFLAEKPLAPVIPLRPELWTEFKEAA